MLLAPVQPSSWKITLYSLYVATLYTWRYLLHPQPVDVNKGLSEHELYKYIYCNEKYSDINSNPGQFMKFKISIGGSGNGRLKNQKNTWKCFLGGSSL
jgi:hypothetical protein